MQIEISMPQDDTDDDFQSITLENAAEVRIAQEATKRVLIRELGRITLRRTDIVGSVVKRYKFWRYPDLAVAKTIMDIATETTGPLKVRENRHADILFSAIIAYDTTDEYSRNFLPPIDIDDRQVAAMSQQLLEAQAQRMEAAAHTASIIELQARRPQ